MVKWEQYENGVQTFKLKNEKRKRNLIKLATRVIFSIKITNFSIILRGVLLTSSFPCRNNDIRQLWESLVLLPPVIAYEYSD